LFIKRDDTKINKALRNTMGRKYHPRAEMVGSVAASRAVAPAGGYTALANTIAAEASPQARAPASHRSSSKLLLSMKSLVMQTPTKAARTCPSTLFRGWASGDSMKLYSNTAAAPYDIALVLGLHGPDVCHTKLATAMGTPWLFISGIINTASMIATPTKAPKKAHHATSTFPIGLRCPSPKKRERGEGNLSSRFRGM